MRAWKKSTTSSPLVLPRNSYTTATPSDKVCTTVCLFERTHLFLRCVHINVGLAVTQMVIWTPCWIVLLWTAASHLPYPAVRSHLKRGVSKPHTVQRIPRHSVQKIHPALKRELQVPKTPVQVRNRQIAKFSVYVMDFLASPQCENTLLNIAWIRW